MSTKSIWNSSLLLVALLLVHCGKGTTGPGGGNTSGEWTLGPERTYHVAVSDSVIVVDSVTGLTFQLPEGGDGDLTVAEIVSGPATPSEGSGFSVDFSGATPVELVTSQTGDTDVVLLAYGSVPACYDDELAANDRWLAVPSLDTTDGQIVFPLLVGDSSAIGALAKPAVRTFKYHWMERISKTSTEAEKELNIEWQSEAFVKQLIDELTGSLKTRVQSEINGRLKVVFTFHDGGPYYKGFWWRSLGAYGRKVKPTLHFRTTLKAPTIAHETGHYLVHALVGDNVQSTLEGQGNVLFAHQIGDDNERKKLLEEYAYFMEYYFTDRVVSYKPENPYTIWGGLNLLPSTSDIPGLEGFGLLMLSGLTRTGDSVQSLVHPQSQEAVPVLGFPFHRAFKIIAEGATDIPGLLADIQAELTPEENKKYQVIMERSGWRYRVTGKLADSSGHGVADVLVSNFLEVGGTKYEGGLSYVSTDANGKFTLTGEVFPGRSTLRFVHGSDTAYADIDVDWSHHTNETVDVGTIAVDFSNILSKLQSTNRVSIMIIAPHFGTHGELYNDGSVFMPSVSHLNWNGTSFEGEDTYHDETTDDNWHVTGEVAPNGRKIITLVFKRRYRELRTDPKPDQVRRQEVDTEIRITDLDYLHKVFSSHRFEIMGPEAAGHVSLKYHRLREWADPDFGTEVTDYTHTNWNDPIEVPIVEVDFL